MAVTAFQTLGPFFDVLLQSRGSCRQIADATPGTRVVIAGTLFDGEPRPIRDGLIETWQADAHGRYRHPDDPRESHADASFCGYGWHHTDADGRFRIETILPGAVAGPDGRLQAPHIVISVMGRGILTRYLTRLYFEGEPANDTDPILALVPAARRTSLIAPRLPDGSYRFDIHLQGPNETVFFDV